MPYIKKERRIRFDPLIAPIAEELDTEGELNYVITMLVLHYISKKGISYGTYNAAVGVLECAKQELYRRWVATYEDKKIKENGDVGL